MEWIIFLIVGSLTGLLAGLFGLSGGVLVVPAFVFIFSLNMPGPYVMHLAVGTSLATMIVTTLASVWAHYRGNSIMMNLCWRFLPGMVIGVLAGTVATHFLPTGVLQEVFAIFLVVIAARMFYEGFLQKPSRRAGPERIPSQTNLSLASIVMGFLAGMLGVGAGTMTIPYFSYYKVSMRNAAGTAAIFSLVIATLGTAMMMIEGYNTVHLPWSTGYVYWPAFFGISIASVCFAPLGTRLSQTLSSLVLKRTFTLVLLLLAASLFIGKL